MVNGRPASIHRAVRARADVRAHQGGAGGREEARQGGGRPPAISTAQRAEVHPMRDEEGRRITEIAQIFRVSVKTVRRA